MKTEFDDIAKHQKDAEVIANEIGGVFMDTKVPIERGALAVSMMYMSLVQETPLLMQKIQKHLMENEFLK